ncbi:prenyltransferase/squalene oxidase repeat-containing protein [Streptomyces yaizuensis]|nr:prenyltransferase/squalene oxidase repeat-containing protein [Streptomyces sp. YSPA8]
MALAGLLTFGAAVTFLTEPAPARAAPARPCAGGAVVAVDFKPFGGTVESGCDLTPTTGYELLRDAGFTTAGTVRDGPAFICRIGYGPFNSGTAYPTPDREDCVLTPPASAYWSYWIAAPGQRKWTYSPLGAMARNLKPGDVDAWVFGATGVGGSTGAPRFTPDDVRGGAGPGPTGSPGPSGPTVPPGAVDVPAAVRWVGGTLKDGERVVTSDGGPDFLLTTEAALALAAADRKSPAAARAAAFLARPAHTEAYAYPAGTEQPPDATAAARLALVAEATGGDPRDFGGRDLLGDLMAHVCRSGIGDVPEPGPGCLTRGDFRTTGQTDGQAMAVIALANGKVAPPVHAVGRLLALQCDDGGFTGTLIRPGESCESEVGATGLVALALKRAGGHDAALGRARDWLTGTQQPGGGFPASPHTTAGSAYATGWAAQALRALGDTRRAAAAVSWLSKQQFPGPTGGGFGFEEGATEPALYATGPAVLAGAGTDLVALTTPPRPTKPSTSPKPTPTGPRPPTTGPPGTGPDLRKGTAYLTDPTRLIEGRYYENLRGSGFADYGLTIDGAFALAATGHDNAALRGIVDFLDRGGEDGTGRGVHDWTHAGTAYAGGGSIGKAALLAQAVGRDPRAFGGKDLVAALERAVCPAKSPPPGRSCAARGAYTHTPSVFGQSLAVIAQLRAGERAAAAKPLAYLLSLQRPGGAWPSLVPSTRDEDVDSTAMAVMALDLAGGAEADAAVTKGLRWLASRQLKDGGFPGAAGNSVNSAALAVQALSLDPAAHAGRIAKARKFLAGQQNRDGGFNVARGGQPGSDVRASTQAVGGATGISFATLTRDLTGTVPRPAPTGPQSPGPTPSPPPIVTTDGGATTGSSGASGAPGPGGGLAATGTQALALGLAAALLTGGGWALTAAVRHRRTTHEEQR